MAETPNKRNPRNLCYRIFTEALSNKRKAILFKTYSSECFLILANIICFKPSVSRLSDGAITLKNFIVGLDVSGSVYVTYKPLLCDAVVCQSIA